LKGETYDHSVMSKFFNLGIHGNVSGARDMKNFVVIGLEVSITQINNFVVTKFFSFCVLQEGYSLHHWTDFYAKYVKRRCSGQRWHPIVIFR